VAVVNPPVPQPTLGRRIKHLMELIARAENDITLALIRDTSRSLRRETVHLSDRAHLHVA
jgi:hypothetical protein